MVKRLGMESPEVISITPEKSNILYIVKDKPDNISEAMLPIVEKLQANLLPTHQKLTIFCRTYDDCSRMYHFFKLQLEGNADIRSSRK